MILYGKPDIPPGGDSAEAMADAVLNKGLENKLDDLAFQAGFINIGMKGEFIAEADALDIYIVIHIADFLGQCHNAGGIMVDAVAQQGGEPRIYLTGGIIPLHLNEGIDDFQGIE